MVDAILDDHREEDVISLRQRCGEFLQDGIDRRLSVIGNHALGGILSDILRCNEANRG